MLGEALIFSNQNEPDAMSVLDLERSKPIYQPQGMAAREFADPEIEGGAQLFLMKAITLLVALGGNGKAT